MRGGDQKMTVAEALAYLEGVADGWSAWGDHHRKLVEAIKIVLDEFDKGGEE